MKKYSLILFFLILQNTDVVSQYYQDFEAGGGRPANWVNAGTFSNSYANCPPQEQLKACSSGMNTSAAFLSTAAFNLLAPTNNYYVTLWTRAQVIKTTETCRFRVCLENQTTLVKTYFNGGSFFDLSPLSSTNTVWTQYNFTFPLGLSTVQQYRIRLEAEIGSAQRLLTDAWSSNANINGCVSSIPAVTINITSGTNPTNGNPIRLDASVTNLGSPTTYKWTQNAVELSNNIISCNIPVTEVDDQIQCTVLTTVSGCLYSVKSNIITILSPPVYTWNGVAWNSTAPTSTNGAVIMGNYNQPTGFQCSSLKIFSNAVLNISDIVVVNGKLSNWGNESNLVVKNGGKLIHNTNNVSGRVELFISGLFWHYVSSPVSGQNVTLYTDAGGGYTNRNFYYYKEPNNDSWDVANNWIGNMGWTNQSSGTMSVATGYSFYYTSDKTYTYSGNLNNGIYSANLTNNTSSYDIKYDGWNLIGNPYPSPVDWEQVTKIGVANSIYYYNGTNYSYYVSSGANEGAGIGANIVTGANGRYIPVGQGFMVKCLNPTGSVVFTNAARTVFSQSFYKSATENILRLQATGNNYQDETVIRFLKTASQEFDGEFDATKLFSFVKKAPQIYSITKNGDELSINSLKKPIDFENQDHLKIPIGFNAEAGQYTITSNYISISCYQTVFLEDTYNQIIINLQKDKYSFTHTGGDVRNRFRVIFGCLTSNDEKVEENIKIWSFKKTIYLALPANSNLSEYSNFEIFNMQGNKIFSSNLCYKNPNELIEIETNLQEGIYVVKIGANAKKVYLR